MALRVYNTLSRQKEPFETLRPGKVGMYVCGPTVYKPSHLGHMVGPVIFDTVKRYLAYSGYDVTLVINITDVDDKLIVEAQKQKTTVPELAERVTADYVANLRKLNVIGIDAMPRATQHMGDILGMIGGLIDKGFAYAAGGDVYFDVSKDDDYGKLCNRDPEQLEAGARIEVSELKRNPGDFALWKGAKPGEPQWESPWGPGRPGWHIECSAMTMKLLGATLDIHGGGLDLQFPHHENELAQSESFNGKQFVRYWMHNGLMKTGDAKMSKSKGNEIVVAELLKRHEAETLRFFLLATHYRRPIDYSEDRLEEQRRGLDSFYRFFERYQRISKASFYDLLAPKKRGTFDVGSSPPEFLVECRRLWEMFLSHMDDDFNTGGAIGVLFELLTALNRFADVKQLEAAGAAAADVQAFQRGVLALKELSDILGIFQQPLKAKHDGAQEKLAAELLKVLHELDAATKGVSGLDSADGIMQRLIEMRATARKTKNFATADQIRQRLTQLGVTIEDRPGGTGWRMV
ncbi:MAG TPA: cysteine--tRNA ligase [Gemmataceae bacterium]|nr:cysteine--tRNA ligase [Gemmataceae bacterium]